MPTCLFSNNVELRIPFIGFRRLESNVFMVTAVKNAIVPILTQSNVLKAKILELVSLAKSAGLHPALMDNALLGLGRSEYAVNLLC